jgi:hypothetical protein
MAAAPSYARPARPRRPNCCAVWEMVPAPAPYGALGAVCPGAPAAELAAAMAARRAHSAYPAAGLAMAPKLREEYADKAALAMGGGVILKVPTPSAHAQRL